MTLKACEQCHELTYAPDLLPRDGKEMCPGCYKRNLNARIVTLENAIAVAIHACKTLVSPSIIIMNLTKALKGET